MRRERLELDFRAAPPASRWPGYALLAAALVAGIGLWDRYREVEEALQRLDAEAELVVTERPRPAAARAPLDEKSAQMAMRQLALPWAGLIEALESAASADVALLQVQPEAQQRVVRLAGEAKHRQAMFAYMQALQKAPGLTQVHLVSDQVQADDPQKPVRFTAQASFRTMR